MRYFGDQMAFFFRFLLHVEHATSILAIVGVLALAWLPRVCLRPFI